MHTVAQEKSLAKTTPTVRTPGEWVYIPGHSSGEQDPLVVSHPGCEEDGVIVAECTLDADARLCAAAPDLLDACELWIASIQACNDPELWVHCSTAIDAAHAAIAKSKGLV
jgi:hypothetical protein